MIYHISSPQDWDAAQLAGDYRNSTRGRTLEDEGFLHAARRDQVAGVFDRYYADAGEPLVLLTIDTDLLEVPWREDQVGADTFPHIYGPIDLAAVVDVIAYPEGPDGYEVPVL